MDRIASTTARYGPSASHPDEVRALAARGFLFGLPLILADLVREAHPRELGRFVRLPGAPAAFASGLSAAHDPNLLSSSAWISLDAAPVVLALPDLHGRHMTVTLHDAWGRYFAGAGSRVTGGLGRDIAIVGPHYRGCLGAGVHAIRSPTTQAWVTIDLWARGPADRAAAVELERRSFLVPLGEPVAPSPGERVRLETTRGVHEQLAGLSAPAFFHRLAGLLAIHPAARAQSAGADTAEVEALAGLGVVPGQPFERRNWRPDLAEALQTGVEEALAQLEAHASRAESGWLAQPVAGEETISERAERAWTSLGAPPRTDVLTLTARTDAIGRRLNGANRYALRFRPGQTPPVEGAWSLDVLDLFGRPVDRVDRPMARLNSDWLRWDDDGGLTITLQRARPGAAPRNWTETPPGDFALSLQLHWPMASALDGRWRPPEITPIHAPSANGRTPRLRRARPELLDHRVPDHDHTRGAASLEGACP